MQSNIKAYNDSLETYSDIGLCLSQLIVKTLHSRKAGRGEALAELTESWESLSNECEEVNSLLDDIKGFSLKPLLGFYIGDLVMIKTGDYEFHSAIVSNIMMPYDLFLKESENSEVYQYQVLLAPAEFIRSRWLSPERAIPLLAMGTIEELRAIIKPKYEKNESQSDPLKSDRSSLDSNALEIVRGICSGIKGRDNIENVRLQLFQNIGSDHSFCDKNDIIAMALLEQAPHVLYPSWSFSKGDIVLAKFKNESCWRHIVFLHIDTMVSKAGMLHYLDGEVFTTPRNVCPSECIQRMQDVEEMKIFMPSNVHELSVDDSNGVLLLTALAQRENLRGTCGRWSAGYQEPDHVVQQRRRLDAYDH